MVSNKKTVLIGAGGHAGAVAEILLMTNVPFSAVCVSQNEGKIHSSLKSVQIITDCDLKTLWSTKKVKLVNGIGKTSSESQRDFVYFSFKKQGFNFSSIVHPNSFVSPSATLHEGAQIMMGAQIGSNVQIGQNSLINSAATIDHDVVIGRNVHIAPGVIICGDVVIEEGVFIGAGSIILPSCTIGRNSFIKAQSRIGLKL